MDTKDKFDLLPAEASLAAPTLSTLRDVSRAKVDLPDEFRPKWVTGVVGVGIGGGAANYNNNNYPDYVNLI